MLLHRCRAEITWERRTSSQEVCFRCSTAVLLAFGPQHIVIIVVIVALTSDRHLDALHGDIALVHAVTESAMCARWLEGRTWAFAHRVEMALSPKEKK